MPFGNPLFARVRVNRASTGLWAASVDTGYHGGASYLLPGYLSEAAARQGGARIARNVFGRVPFFVAEGR